MLIETKFNMRDGVWFIKAERRHETHPCSECGQEVVDRNDMPWVAIGERTVLSIGSHTFTDGASEIQHNIRYYLGGQDYPCEAAVFPTREQAQTECDRRNAKAAGSASTR